jgi:hypothetical protein
MAKDLSSDQATYICVVGGAGRGQMTTVEDEGGLIPTPSSPVFRRAHAHRACLSTLFLPWFCCRFHPNCYRRDECERVKAAGARVLTLDQIEGLKDPSVEAWTTEEDDDGDPPRLWFPNGMYPGTAFTRSIGDAGVCGAVLCVC